MLDLNYVRANLERVRAALEARGFPTTALEDFAALDAERRRAIAESDSLNARRNASSRDRATSSARIVTVE
jgi:seryl-tRNA synthetase